MLCFLPGHPLEGFPHAIWLKLARETWRNYCEEAFPFLLLLPLYLKLHVTEQNHMIVLNALALYFSELAIHHAKLLNLLKGDTMQSSPSKTHTFSNAGLWWIQQNALLTMQHVMQHEAHLFWALQPSHSWSQHHTGASFHIARKTDNTSDWEGSSKRIKQFNRGTLLVRF